jgi:hypothetical protein
MECLHCGRTRSIQNDLGFCIRTNCQGRYEKEQKAEQKTNENIPIKKTWAEIYKDY